MPSRRRFLQLSIAASALPLALPAAADSMSAAAPRPTALPLYKVLYDVRFPASVAFARRAAERGVAVQATTGDVTRFWYDDLYYRWAQGAVALAGCTAHGALFCLERLAWDQRMRVVFRAEHERTASGGTAHRVSAPAPLLPAACRAVAAPEWASAIADIVTRCPVDRAATAAAEVVTAAAYVQASESEPLFSWVIAPVARS